MADDLKPPRPLRADAARNRERILEAARVVFAERGLDGTMDDIAHAAGLGVGTVYRRFSDREALVDALFEENIEAHVTYAERALADHDPWTGFETYVQSTCRDMAEDRGLREVLLGTSYGQKRVEAGRGRIRPLTQEIVERARDAGALRPDFEVSDIGVITLMVCAVADYTQPVQPGLWRRYLALLLDAVRSGPGQTDLAALPALALDGLAQGLSTQRATRRAKA